MRYLVIGLGIYGTNLVKDLSEMGHEVIGADCNSSAVDSVKDYMSASYIIDTTDEEALAALPLKNVDLVVVAIGENFGASVKTVALLRQLGVRAIYARAIDELHYAILEGLKVERILNPEQRAAFDLVNELALGSEVESMRVDDENYILRFRIPSYFIAMTYSEVSKSKVMYGMRLIAASRVKPGSNILGLRSNRLHQLVLDDTVRVEEGDVITCMGTFNDYKRLFRNIQ